MRSDVLHPPRHPVVRPSFGRVSVSVHGRVMRAIAEGPFDADLMAATKRALALAGKRLPADRRFCDLIEIRGSLQMDASALAELAAGLHGFALQGLVALSTVFLVQPGIPGLERLRSLMDVWRASRPVRRAHTFEAAWALINADLLAAGLPPQAPAASARVVRTASRVAPAAVAPTAHPAPAHRHRRTDGP